MMRVQTLFNEECLNKNRTALPLFIFNIFFDIYLVSYLKFFNKK